MKTPGVDRQKEKSIKKTIVFWVRFVFGITVFIVTLSYVDFEIIKTSFSKINPVPVIAVLILLILNALIVALRFELIASEPGKKIPFRFSIHVVFIGNFLNVVMPSNFGGDVVRLWYGRKIIPFENLTYSLFLDRIFGLMILFVFMTIGIYFLAPPLPEFFFNIHFAVALLFLLVILFILFSPPKNLTSTIFNRIEKYKIFNAIKYIIDSDYLTIIKYLPRISKIIPLIVIQFIVIFTIFWLSAISININLELIDFFWIIPILNIILIIPISVSDFGIREGVLAYLLSFQNIDVSEAISFALLFRIVHTSYNLLCGIAWLKQVEPPAKLP